MDTRYSTGKRIKIASIGKPTTFSTEFPPNLLLNDPTALLRKNKVELDEILKQAGCFIYMKDRNGSYVYANENIEIFFDASLADIIGRNDDDFFDYETATELKCTDNRVIRFGETIHSVNKMIVKSTDETKICRSVKQPIHNEQGEIIGLCGIFTDITKFTQTEDTLNQIIKHLTPDTHATSMHALESKKSSDTEFRVCWPDGTVRNIRVITTITHDTFGKSLLVTDTTNADTTSPIQSDDFMRLASTIYQSSSEAIMVTDANNTIRQINPAFTRMTGYELSEVVGKNPRIFNSGRHDRAFYQEMWRAIKKDDHWQGEIWDRHKDGTIHARWLNISVIRHSGGDVYCYVAQFSDITEKKRKDDLILTQANYDQLTGLPNRNLFKDRLAQEIKKSRRNGLLLVLFLLDLDHFKEINDTLGHDAGDELLKEAAQRIKSCVREIDTVARLGGDEFIVILPEISNRLRIEMVAQQIIQVLNKPYQFNQNQVIHHISTSIGIATFPEDSTSMECLLKYADQAMYAAKQQGCGRFCYFAPAMQQKANEKMTLIRDLRYALMRNELQIYYQPILDLANRHIAKAEALLRWEHPRHGMIDPAIFIPLAEESGLIQEIGEWVFDQVISRIQQWHRMYNNMIQVSVNKSPTQFRYGGELSWPAKLIQQGLPGNCINIEITEGMLLTDTPEVKQRLKEFRRNGIEISIDDFGTGFSSLAYLRNFDIDYLKIDRAFTSNLVDNTTDQALVEAIIMMAHKLNIKTIAEGVETQNQQELLIKLGCDYVQGNFYSLPIPADAFEKLIHQK